MRCGCGAGTRKPRTRRRGCRRWPLGCRCWKSTSGLRRPVSLGRNPAYAPLLDRLDWSDLTVDTKRLPGRHRHVTRVRDTPLVGRAVERLETPLDPVTTNPSRSMSPQRRGRVLVVEDEPDVAELIRYNLVKEGWEVLTAGTGADALRRVRDARPDVVLLDIMVPQLNGWEVCRRLKEGADDYVTKPFSPRELIARIRAVARRRAGTEEDPKRLLVKAGELEIDRYRFEVRMKGRPVELTPKEFELLAVLAGTPGRVFGRDELLDVVWGRDGFVEPRTVDVHLARLRRKFVLAKLPAPRIDTVRGVGYRFRESEAGER